MISNYEIEQAIPEVRICNIDERCTKSIMLPRVIVDFIYNDKLKTLHIYLDNSKVDDKDYILDKVKDAIRNYIKWFDNNLN